MKERVSTKEDRIDARCGVLAEVIKALQPIYSRSSSDEKNLLETIVGAGIWYLPKPSSAWTGKISLEALKSFIAVQGGQKARISEEHVLPRKLAARELLQFKKLTPAHFRKLYREIYGRVHYVTPRENKVLVKFQKSTGSRLEGNIYKKAGVQLIKLSQAQMQRLRRGDITVALSRYLQYSPGLDRKGRKR